MLAIIDYFQRLTSEAYNPVSILIEWLLIGVVVYSVLRFLAGTRGARLMKGVALLLLVTFLVVRVVAERFELERIQILYRYFLAAAFLTVLVVFQPELRRGLTRLGGTSWLARWMRRPPRVADRIVPAVARLSAQRIGALIAVERQVGLAGLIESGVRLDAELSSELLQTIFWPGSMLHDMGVIIQADRVVGAGCQFPLADSAEVDRSLGSRHRAAVGLSTDSDAVVIVVSDETGIISLAERGRLRRDLSPEELDTALGDLLGEAVAAPAPTPAAAGTTQSGDSGEAHGSAGEARRPDDRVDGPDLVLRGSSEQQE